MRYGANATANVPAKPLRPSGIKIAKPIQHILANRAVITDVIEAIFVFIFYYPLIDLLQVTFQCSLHSLNFR